MSLSDWEKNGWVVAHQTSPGEIRNLLEVVDRDLADSDAGRISPDWRMNIAYNAALQAASAALAAAGYRATRDQHHYRIIQSLSETIGLKAERVALFDSFRRKRNVAGYERAGLISEKDAKAMRDLAVELRKQVRAWMKKQHAGLMKAPPEST